MSKSPKEMYAVPEWMRQYLPLFHNTGGNDVEELLHDEDTNMFANSIRYMLIVSVRSQFTLLKDMHARGLLAERHHEPAKGEVLVTVVGFTGSGKSAIAGEIEIAIKAIGVPVWWKNGDAEKRMTGADWLTAIELYNPTVRIVEVNIPFTAAGTGE